MKRRDSLVEIARQLKSSADLDPNLKNRIETMAMFGIEAHETRPDGSRRYLSVDEVRQGITFTDGQLRYIEGDKVLPSDTIGKLLGGARTALPMLRSRCV